MLRTTKKEVIEKIKSAGLDIVREERVNNCGDKLSVSNGAIITVYDKGTCRVQGKHSDETEQLLSGGLASHLERTKKKVFVVYGHDSIARTQLEAMLRRWDLEPLILDQLPSSGNTIIEKLGAYTKFVEFGIVLATPDDMGYAVRDGETNVKYRVRQNVVLELGMLLATIGREKVAILLKENDSFERPSDIDGLIYIPFNKNVEEGKVSLAKEMEKHHYKIELAKL